jgi:hypothetical protein
MKDAKSSNAVTSVSSHLKRRNAEVANSAKQLAIGVHKGDAVIALICLFRMPRDPTVQQGLLHAEALARATNIDAVRVRDRLISATGDMSAGF